MDILNNLQPQVVWKYFEKICSIPHPSRHEKELRNYIIDIAKSNGCEYEVDDYGNLLVTKKSTVGCDNFKRVILQGHLDMVSQKDVDLEFDFKNDSLNLEIFDDEFITADGTTLGADNGIGVAVMLAVISDDIIAHGELRFLFTIEEEIGLNGASNLNPKFMDSDILINLDSEDEGQIFIGCAGGIRTDAEATISTQNVTILNDDGHEINQKIHLVIDGLHGGHSGCDIHLNLGNGLKIISEIIWEMINKFSDIKLRYLAGGNADNAIVRRAEAYLFCCKNEMNEITKFIAAQNEKYQKLLPTQDKNVQIVLKEITPRNSNKTAPAYSDEFQNKLLATLLNCPNGVINHHYEMDGVVETSTNLAIVTADCLDKPPVNGKCFKMKITSSQRSSDNLVLMALAKRLAIHFSQLSDCKVIHRSHYSGWTPNPHSEILEIAKESLQKTLEIDPEITAIHAGLECGALSEYNQDIDMISIGPDIISPHSPHEKVRIKSVEKFYGWLHHILENIPQK